MLGLERYVHPAPIAEGAGWVAAAAGILRLYERPEHRSRSPDWDSSGTQPERWIALQVCEQVAESTVVEDAIAQPDRGFAVAEGIPSQAKPRLEFVGVAGEYLAAGIASGGLERDRCRIPGVLVQKIRDIAVALERNTIVLIAQAELQSQVRANLPGILEKHAVFVLYEASVIGGGALATRIVKLGLRLNARHAQQRGRHGLQIFVVATGTVHNRDTEIAEGGEIDRRARAESVVAVVINVTELAADLDVVLARCPGEVIDIVPGARAGETGRCCRLGITAEIRDRGTPFAVVKL